MERTDLEYVDFWPRVGAMLIDTVMLFMICWPLMLWVYGPSIWTNQAFIRGPADFFISWVMPAAVTIFFWSQWQATPGKMAISARIVDATTGQTPGVERLVLRYLGYLVSMLPLFLGYIWIAFDPRRQAWHDKLAGTVVVRSKDRRPAAVRFDR